MRSDPEDPAHEVLRRLEEANERLEVRAGRNLPQAIGVGLLIGAATFLAVVFSPLVFSAFVAIAAALCCSEIAGAIRHRDVWLPRVGLAIGGGLAPLATGWLGLGWGVVLLGVGVVLFLVWMGVGAALTGRRLRASAVALGCAFLVYIAATAAAAVALDVRGGPGPVLGFLIVVIVHDICAYAVGRTWGRHPMAPRTSPHKTWEGQAGATVGAIVAGIVVALTPLWGLPWWAGAINGVMLMLSATGGDLLESRVKRWIGVKDMGSLLPGHGGLLDRVDAILLSAPMALILHVLWGLVL